MKSAVNCNKATINAAVFKHICTIDLEEEHMKPYGVNELRRMFLEFFESKEHLKMKSFSLVPHNEIGRAHV